MDIEEKLKTMKTSQGVSLYDHLLNTLGRLAETHPRNPLGSFEEHSQFVRDTGYHYADGRNYRDADGRMYKGQEEYLNKTAKYWGFYKEEVAADGDDAGGQAAEPGQIGYVADLVSEERILRRAGLGFGELETYKIYTALKKFVQARNAEYARFWGKIFGTTKDYYIIEAKAEAQGGDAPPEEITEPHEPKDTGINKKQFFVTNDSSFS